MILDGKKVSDEIISRVKEEVIRLEKKPKVVDIVIGDDLSSLAYTKRKQSACNKVGIDFEFVNFNSNTLEEEIISYIENLNNDKNIDAIMIQIPIPDRFNTNRIINSISFNKDVDGLTNYNRLNNNIIPCTPKAILKILDYYNIDLKNKKVVLVGRGVLVGNPLFELLKKEECNLIVCNSKTENLSTITNSADILICATNRCNIITKDMVNNNCIILDAGSSYIEGKIYGNVCKDVYDKVKYITPVPGGIGPVTVASFIENVLICYRKNRKIEYNEYTIIINRRKYEE